MTTKLQFDTLRYCRANAGRMGLWCGQDVAGLIAVEVQTLRARHTALVEAVAWERECVFAFADDDWSFLFDDCARDELVATVNAACDFTDALLVDRLIGNETAADCKGGK